MRPCPRGPCLKPPSGFADEAVVSPTSANARELLLSAQNPDGGWGYFPGRKSWLEPTSYACLALHETPGAKSVLERAHRRIISWQRSDGGWAPNEAVRHSTWVTALAITVLASARRTAEAPFQRGVEWLTGTVGAEAFWLNRLTVRLGLADHGRDPSLTGWPWLEGTSSWVEPTAHALTALRTAAGRTAVAGRIDVGTREIWSLRCADGGWNYGAPRALKIDLPSYPETTALALVGLAGSSHEKLAAAVEHARSLAARPQPPLASAWLSIALRLHGEEPEREPAPPGPESDLLAASLHLLAQPDGNWRLLGGAR